uniref:Uncharacterized protein n=1 Tax=Acrobeloides nanus TaxID=290746 RepID=A0A914CQ80_9BILA
MQEEVQNQRILSNGPEGKLDLSDLIEEELRTKGFTHRDIQLLVALSAWQSATKEGERLPNWAKTWIKEIGFEEQKHEKFKETNTHLTFMNRCKARLQIKNERLVRFISEFFATALLL